ncbi:MAG: hypothetical protein LLF92_11790 [Planctomycetaceae bacterium]|nr:hypothetical protein [Planctomycetaceae bacterium]
MTEQNEKFDLTELKKDSQEIDELFERFPAPEPSPALVDDIKRRIYSKKQRIGIPALILKTASVAAVLLFAWFFVFDDTNTKKPVASISESSNSVFAQADESISEFEKDIELLRSEFLSVCLNEDSSGSLMSDSVTTLESEIIETDYSFWKG